MFVHIYIKLFHWCLSSRQKQWMVDILKLLFIEWTVEKKTGEYIENGGYMIPYFQECPYIDFNTIKGSCFFCCLCLKKPKVHEHNGVKYICTAEKCRIIDKEKEKHPFFFSLLQSVQRSFLKIQGMYPKQKHFQSYRPSCSHTSTRKFTISCEIKILKFLFIEWTVEKEMTKTSTANLQTRELDGEKAVLYPVNCHMLHANWKQMHIYTHSMEVNMSYKEIFSSRFLYVYGA